MNRRGTDSNLLLTDKNVSKNNGYGEKEEE